MTRLNPEKNELNCKLIYFGPPQAGKTTNLAAIEDNLRAKRAPDSDSELALAGPDTEQDKAYDYLKVPLGRFGALELRLHLYTVPERASGRREAVRRMILKDLDGVVFVADSSREAMAANVHALQCLEEDLRRQGRCLADVPVVFQWNKRDAKSAARITELEALLNPTGKPSIEAQADLGRGVFATLKTAARESLDAFARDHNLDWRETRRLSREEVVQAIRLAHRAEIERPGPKASRRRPATTQTRRQGFEIQGVRTGPFARLRALLGRLQAAASLL